MFKSLLVIIAIVLLSCNSIFAATQLQPGIAIQSTVSVGSYTYFYYSPTTLLTGQKLVFIITPYSGDPDLYISQLTETPTVSTNQWNSTFANGDMVRIYQEDPKYSAEKTTYVGVYLSSSYGYAQSSFSIMGYISGGMVTLVDGIPQVAYASSGNYVNFLYALPSRTNFSISVSPFYGDPDVYVSTTNTRPTTTNNTWYERGFGYDILDITTSDPNFIAPANYYIAVQSFLTSQYSIVATQTTTNAVLMEALPMIRSVRKGTYIFFKFNLAARTALTITATSLSPNGDPDIYVSKINQQPTQNTGFTWSAFSPGEDALTIYSNDPNGGPGWYYIGCYGFLDSVFQIVANTELDPVTLVDGIPQEAQGAAGMYNYYKFLNMDDTVALTITASIISTGRVRLLVSSTNPTPVNAPGKFDKASDSVSGNAVIQFPTPSPVGWVYIGVQHLSVGGLINYTVTAQTNQSYTILLANQLSFFNFVPQGTYRYFLFDNLQSGQDVSFTVSPWVGDPDLFVSTINSKPSMTNFTFRSNRAGADSVVVLTSNPNYITGLYYISVYGFIDTYFSIAAYLSGSAFPLQSGIATPGTVLSQQYQYYTFVLTHTADITIQLQVDADSQGSDPDIYVSTSVQKPNQYHYTWKSINYGDDVVFISQAQPTTYYIGIYGFNNATFTITAVAGSTYLVDGYQIMDNVEIGNYRYYQFFVPNTTEVLLASVTLINGFTTLVLSNNITENPFPTITNNTAAISSFPGNNVLMQQGDVNFIPGLQYVIGVYGQTNSDYFVSVQTFSANILAGIPLLAVAPFNKYVRFRFFVLTDLDTNTIVQHTISLRVLHGAPSLYASQITDMPEQNPTWTYTGREDGIIIIPGSELQSGYIYISVTGNSTLNDAFYPNFEITVIPANEPTYLVQDQTITQYTNPDQYSFYSIYTLNIMQNLFILVESCSNYEAPTFYISKFTSQPTQQNHTFASSLAESRHNYASTLLMTADSSIIYNVGVYGNNPSGTKYSIFTSTTGVQHPMPQNEGLLEVSGFEDLTIKFSGANVNSYPAVYRAYIMEVSSDYSLESTNQPYNFFTTCGVVNNGNEVGFFAVTEEAFNSNIEITFTVSRRSDYLLNVIASDSFGLQSAYQPILIRNGRYYDGNPGWVGLSFGLIVLILVPIVIALYLGIGVTIKAVKGARGIEIIPNIEFWRSVPTLVWEGILFLFTFGGKIGKGYQKLYTNVNSSEQYGGETVSSSNNNTSDKNGTYGAI